MMNLERPAVQSSRVEGSCRLPEARSIPDHYEPNYAYPLLVLFHGRGQDEHGILGSFAGLSRRNYVGLAMRGPEVVHRDGQPRGHGWGEAFGRPVRSGGFREAGPGPRETVRRYVEDGWVDEVDRVEQATFQAIRDLRRGVHVHSERIFLVGVGEGAAVAFRIGLAHPERFAGVVSINGWLPGGAPLVRVRACRSLRMLVVHGEWNSRTPVGVARRDVRTLRAGGLRVAFQSYPCAHRVTRPMLADVDTWVMRQCTRKV
jgi:phospholipase/carboxylesterase